MFFFKSAEGAWDYWSHKYDNLWANKNSLTPTRHAVMKLLEHIITDKEKIYNIIDVGCGTGVLIKMIINHFSEYKLKIDGIDISEGMLEEAKKKEFDTKVSLKKMNVIDLKGQNKKYDIIVGTHSFPHYLNQNKAVNIFYKLLKDEGCVIMGQALKNNLYDHFFLGFVSLMVGPQNYQSTKKVDRIFSINHFKKIETSKVAKHFLVCSIEVALYKKNIS